MTMPIRFIDGGDTIDSTHEGIRWTGGAATIDAPGRFGYGQYLQPVALFKTFLGGPYVYACAAGAFKWATISGDPVVIEFGNGNQHVRLTRNSSGFLTMKDSNGTVLQTYSSSTLTAETWYAIGFAAKWSDVGLGQLRVWLGGHLVMSQDNVDSDNQASASDEFSYVLISSHTDDFYVSANDTIAGSLDDEYRGDLVVRESFPISDGFYQDWTQSSGGTKFGVVDEIGPDDDGTYLSSNTAGHRCSFTVTPASADLASIIAIQMNTVARFDTTAPHDIKHFIRNVGGATNNDEAAQAIAVTYAAYHNVRETDPFTGLQFTVSGFNSREYGTKLDV